MYFEEAIERINNINWNAVGKYTSEIHVVLGTEFLRRLACFFKDESIKPRMPLIANIAILLGDVGEQLDISECCNSKVVKFLGTGIYIKNIVDFYIQLAKYADKNPSASKYLMVYEPLIKILEEGGMYVLRSNSLEIKDFMYFPLDNWYGNYIKKEPFNID